MKVFIFSLFFISALAAMHDEPPLKRGNHPELMYFRLMEKVHWTQEQINYLKMYSIKTDEFSEQLDRLQSKLDRLQAKLQAHEND